MTASLRRGTCLMQLQLQWRRNSPVSATSEPRRWRRWTAPDPTLQGTHCTATACTSQHMKTFSTFATQTSTSLRIKLLRWYLHCKWRHPGHLLTWFTFQLVLLTNYTSFTCLLLFYIFSLCAFYFALCALCKVQQKTPDLSSRSCTLPTLEHSGCGGGHTYLLT